MATLLHGHWPPALCVTGTWRYDCAVVQGLQIEDSELREYTHGMLGSIAEKLGKDFAPFLPHAVEAAFASRSQVSRCCCLSLRHPPMLRPDTSMRNYHPGDPGSPGACSGRVMS